ncbi:hypothetical protein PCCS19_16440 [Paenibacillus sp. CCS19]|uniref:condensation domain-containing protein n=1 Tax=Paenibacillus sp. CCS19 TaxID=3158387 RepID=UPI00256A6633|nr:condensation domain-containing protein [Paenibacillus cellulosilyticus]GMK38590.1 hypothetical protein PCCS19_16440 [Paenibacillus cellulosilyticus]
MDKVFKSIIEHTAAGKIDKAAAIEVIEMLRAAENEPDEPIAIIGAAAQLPTADDVEQFWHNIRNGVDSIRSFPEERQADIRNYLRFIGTPEEQIQFGEGAFLDEIDKFDYPFFRLSPKEASLMDPNQRLFMQVAYHALEDAGYGGERLAGSRTGVYTGFADTIKDKYQKQILDVEPSSVSISIAANLAAMIPTRLSYMLDLRGPTVLVDTACSSGLVTIHLACQGIRSGDCDVAVAGAIKLHTMPLSAETYQTGVESSDYRTRTFDDKSDGAGIGEGSVAFVLKPLKRAMQDGDSIYAVIRGSAINQDGTSLGITAPNPRAQTDAIVRAWEKTGVDPETIAYIETHGTGTELGDVIEMQGLADAFARFTDKKQFCAIGSVKPNIGHLYECAGMANLLKAVLALKNRELPPTIHFDTPNRKIDFIDSPVYVNAKLRRWDSDATRRSGVSSFGFSGTNCHLILEEAPQQASAIELVEPMETIHTLALSAKTRDGLLSLVTQYRDWIEAQDIVPLQDMCFTANVGRGHYEHRLAFVFSTARQLLEQVNAVIEAGGDWERGEIATAPGVLYGVHRMVAQHKESRVATDLTEGERRKLTERANEELREWERKQLNKREEQLAFAHLLSGLYVEGAQVDWKLLYQGRKVQACRLPLYPYERYRCWLDIPETPKSAERDEEAAYYQLGWIPSAIDLDNVGNMNASTAANVSGTTLILQGRGDDLGTAIAQQLRELGQFVVEAGIGGVDEARVEDGGQRYEISASKDDCEWLFNQLRGQAVRRIVLTGSDTIGLFRTVKAMLHEGYDQELELIIVTKEAFVIDGSERQAAPESAALVGLGQAIGREHPEWRCRAIDVDATVDRRLIGQELLREGGDSLVAYRGGGSRYVRELQPLDPNALAERPLELREDGIYVITGGLGDIGLEIARYLASQKRVHLALIGRTPFPAREAWPALLQASDVETSILRTKVEEIMAIEAMGSTVDCYAADISDAARMKEIGESIKQRYRASVYGVVHSAGVAGQQMLASQQEDSFRQGLSAKMAGTRVLEQWLADEPLDFIILFSSLATFFPAPGQADYIAANTFLDAYAASRSNQGVRTMTINWPTWKERGMALRAGFTEDTLMKAVTTQEAMERFDRIVNRDVTNVLIGSLHYESSTIQLLRRMPNRLHASIENKLQQRSGAAVGKHQAKPVQMGGPARAVKLIGRGNEQYTQTELHVGQVWAETLGIYEMDVDSNYYEMGGDSVLGTRIVNTLNKQLQLQLHPGDMLKHLTVRKFAAYLDAYMREADAGSSSDARYAESATIPQAPIQDVYPVSSAQNRMFITDRMDGAGIAYNHPRFMYIDGDLDVPKFTNVIHQLIRRHDALRTSFELSDDGPIQRIHEDAAFDIPYAAEYSEADIPRMIAEFIRPFRLDEAPLLRMSLARLGPNRHFLLFDMHHIICDGVSLDTFIAEMVGLYEGRQLPPQRLQYKDYAAWELKRLTEGGLRKEEAYWEDKFRDGVPMLELPTDYARPKSARKTNDGDQVTFKLPEAALQQLKQLAIRTDATLYMLLLASYHIVLAKHSGQDDLVIGSAVMGRRHEDVQSMMGVFINMLPMHNRMASQETLLQFVQAVRQQAIEAFDHQELPFDAMVDRLCKQRDRSRHPMFDVSFILQNTASKEIRFSDLRVTPYPFYDGTTKMDIALEAAEIGNELAFQWTYSSSLFHRSTMEVWSRDYLHLLESLPTLLHKPIEHIVLASSEDTDYGTEQELEFSF